MTDNFMYDLGAQIVLDNAVFGVNLNSLRFILVSDSITLNPSDTTTFGYTQPTSLPGYAPIESFTWTAALGNDSSGGHATFGNVSWTFGANAGTTTLYGWVCDGLGTDWPFWGGSFSPPFAVPAGGAILALSPLVVSLGTCSLPPPPPPLSPFLLNATFDVPDGSSLVAYVPEIGPSATTFTQSGTVNSDVLGHMGRLSQTVSTRSGCIWNLPASDIRFVGFVRAQPASEDCGLCFRWTDPYNFMLLDFDGNFSHFGLFSCVAGVFTVLHYVGYTPSVGNDHWIELLAKGDSVTATLDGAVSFTYGSATFNVSATRHGIYMGGESSTPTVTFSGLSISKLS